MATEVFTGTKEKDQYQRRQHGVVLRDQFDRRWDTTVDTDSGGPCAPINPKGWTDILDTPAKFKRLKKDEDGRLSLDIAVDEWIAYLERAHDLYEDKLYSDALAFFGQAGLAMYERRDPVLIKHTGPSPQPVEPILALKDGNPWILGTTTTPDPRLTKYFVKRVKVRPSFKAIPDEATAEHLQDIEETADAEAVGGKIQKVGAPKAKKPSKQLVET